MALETGLPPNKNTKNVIYESFKPEDNYLAGLEKLSNKDKLRIYDSENQMNILEFIQDMM